MNGLDDAITERCWDRVAARGGKVPLSHRVRANSEAAPWVIEEIRKMEAREAAVDELIEAASEAVTSGCPCPSCARVHAALANVGHKS